ncbi:MAG: hypothetical protein LBH98_02670 [Chitinispirillales bacterium]|jgi:hypothetical protein|nr:hypothetical protein [Chitinispirillales bacterium]
MNNFKHPQYLTPKGFTRTVKKPSIRTQRKNAASASASAASTVNPQLPARLRALAEKRVTAKRILQKQKEGISEEAAKMIAEAIKTLLHS